MTTREEAKIRAEIVAERRAEREEAIRRMDREGVRTDIIAQRLGITTRTVTRYRERMGALLQAPKQPFTDEERAIAEKMLDDGCSYTEITRTLGRGSLHAVRKNFPGRGWTRQQTGEWGMLMRYAKRDGIV